LDSMEIASMPADCFVSVRIGDTQRFSRLQSSRVFKFPKAGDRRYGKIEVFRRIGVCGVDVDPGNTDLRELTIDGFGTLGLKVEAAGEERPGKLAEESSEVKKESSGKVKAAKEYLGKHGLEVRLAEAMQAVLRERPADPAEFMAAKLLENASRAGGVKLPAPQAAQKESAGAPQPKRPLAGNTEDKPQNVVIDLAKPKQALPSTTVPDVGLVGKAAPVAFALLPFEKLPSVGTWLQAIPRLVKDAVVAKVPPATFNVKPSVGTWLMPLPYARKTQSSQQTPALLPTFELKPSVGTWLMPLPHARKIQPSGGARLALYPTALKPQPPLQQDAFKVLPSVGTWLMPLPRARKMQPSGGVRLALCPTAPKPQLPLQQDAFKVLPSVGTWLTLRPRARKTQSAQEAPALLPTFELKPPAGTQLALLPPAPKPQSPPQQDAFKVLPSVGTWLMPLPRARKTQRAQEAPALLPTFELKPSVGTWLALRPPAPKPQPPLKQDAFKVLPSMGARTAPVLRRSRRLAKTASAADRPSAAQGTKAARVHKPSLAAPVPGLEYEKKPSVATWLAPIFKRRE